MKVIILEDEPLASKRIEQIIDTNFPDFEVIAKAQSLAEAKHALINNDYNILLCDIHLADGLSLDLFKEVDLKCPTIFITAYDQYAIRSFEHNCIDYILKPIEEEKLVKALKKAKQNHLQNSIQSIPDTLLKSLLDAYKLQKYKKRFICKMGNKIVFKQADEIAYFFIEDKVVFLQEAETGKKYIINHSLDELEHELLDPYMFYRINRSTIVNLNHLVEMKKYNNGRLKLIVSAKSEYDLIVARERVSSFKDWVSQ